MSEHAIQNAKAWLETIHELATRLSDKGPDCDAIRERADEEAMQSALSVQVRDGWRQLGESPSRNAEEFEVMLTWGGPALRIYGELDDGEPTGIELQWQDWGTPWTDYPTTDADDAAILAFLSAFHFGSYEDMD